MVGKETKYRPKKGKAMYDYQVEAKRFFIQGKKLNRKGKPVTLPITHRKMELEGKPDIFGITRYRIVVIRRGGKNFFSVSYLPAETRNVWDNSIIEKPTELVREKEPSGKATKPYDEKGILNWLKYRVASPSVALAELLTCPVI